MTNLMLLSCIILLTVNCVKSDQTSNESEDIVHRMVRAAVSSSKKQGELILLNPDPADSRCNAVVFLYPNQLHLLIKTVDMTKECGKSVMFQQKSKSESSN